MWQLLQQEKVQWLVHNVVECAARIKVLDIGLTAHR
jgi:hypothetical protein